MRVAAILALLVACAPEQGLVPNGTEPTSDAPPDTDEPTTPTDTEDPTSPTSPTSPTDPTDPTDPTTPTDTGTAPTDTGTPPPVTRAPTVGEVVIVELMINPVATGDADGEWVEILVTGRDPVDLYGLSLGDDNVDDAIVDEVAPGSLILQPGQIAVLCADGDPALNGGVTCAGTYLYQGFGGGLALANAGDEVELRLGGLVLDRFTWVDGFAPAGASIGVDPDFADDLGNDDPTAWCAQSAALASGDLGSPGVVNDEC